MLTRVLSQHVANADCTQSTTPRTRTGLLPRSPPRRRGVISCIYPGGNWVPRLRPPSQSEAELAPDQAAVRYPLSGTLGEVQPPPLSPGRSECGCLQPPPPAAGAGSPTPAALLTPARPAPRGEQASPDPNLSSPRT